MYKNCREYCPTTGSSLPKTEMKPLCGMTLAVFYLMNRVLNSCTVKDPSKIVFRNYVTEAKEKNKMVVVAGCVPQGSALRPPKR